MNETKEKLGSAFNEWMRRYIEDPAAFEAEFRTVQDFLAEKAGGKEPSYGAICVEYLELLMR
jgi:hypothetical protein